jgi:hypothetical protein
VVAGDNRLAGTLGFDHHRQLLEQFLSAQGYRVVDATQTDDSDLIVFLSYGIDQGHTEASAEPSGLSMGAGFDTGSTGRHSSMLYGSYWMPIYASAADTSNSETLYTSAVAVDIVERSSLGDGDPKRLYEGRARSRNRCASITPIFDEMLTALFVDYPGVSGETHTKTIKSNGDSC